jgi:hypothetical protein
VKRVLCSPIPALLLLSAGEKLSVRLVEACLRITNRVARCRQ